MLSFLSPVFSNVDVVVSLSSFAGPLLTIPDADSNFKVEISEIFNVTVS